MLIQARQQTSPGQAPPLFPPSMAQHHFELALLRRGHTLDVFYRNLPALANGDIQRVHEHHHTQRITPRRVLTALAHRLPPRLNPDKRARNAQLIAQARRFVPDVLWVVGDNTVIYPQTLAQIKADTGCKIVYASGTSPIVFSHAIEREAARLYDLVLVNDLYHGAQWLELGAARAEVLPIAAVNPDFHRPYTLTDAERERYTVNVAFVGTLLPDNLYRRRVEVLEALRDFDLGVWSVHDVPQSLRPHYRGSALGEDMMRVMSAAKLTVNVHGDFMRYGGNMRLFEAAGVGVCQVADDLPGVRRWFTPGEHIATFTTPDDLRQTVARLLADDAERARLAANARQHVYAHHTYDARAAHFEALLGGSQ
jgi:glycosyltransferase involved in cell wall biosynthesis